MNFQLDERLQQGCALVGDLLLCQVLLMRDANYPWVLLVPKRAGIREIYELDNLDQEQLCWESTFVAKRMAVAFHADKMNVAALGNVVPQLHVHHIVRHQGDPAWPNPVWGAVPAQPYEPDALAQRLGQLQQLFASSAFTAHDGSLN